MPLDICCHAPACHAPSPQGLGAPVRRNIDRGLRNHLAGQSAEEGVARLYLDQGYQLLERRWRGAHGELDLVFCRGDDLTVIEVKRGATHAIAAEHLRSGQLRRIYRAAEEYLFTRHLTGKRALLPVDLVISLALVDGMGMIKVFDAGFFL